MGANQAAYPGERIVLANQLHSFTITSLADQTYITRDIYARRTGHLTGSGSKDVAVTRWTVESFYVTLVYFPVLGQTFGGNLTESDALLVVPFHQKGCQRFHGSKVL
jgi:hypothetical protein